MCLLCSFNIIIISIACLQFKHIKADIKDMYDTNVYVAKQD